MHNIITQVSFRLETVYNVLYQHEIMILSWISLFSNNQTISCSDFLKQH